MDAAHLAEALFARAVAREQAVMRCDTSTPVDDIRAAVRRLARDRDIPIRTGLVDDVLVVVLSDADIWKESASVMRSKLLAPETPHVIA